MSEEVLEEVKKSATYGAENITVLKGLEAVRQFKHPEYEHRGEYFSNSIVTQLRAAGRAAAGARLRRRVGGQAAPGPPDRRGRQRPGPAHRRGDAARSGDRVLGAGLRRSRGRDPRQRARPGGGRGAPPWKSPAARG